MASVFIHGDILVLVSEFVVVVILSEWWSVPTTVGTSLGIVEGAYNVIQSGVCKLLVQFSEATFLY